MNAKPLLLMILDGWGLSESRGNNAVAQAKTPHFDRIWKTFPHTRLDASAEAVGLPKATIGNSEVGHMNIGAGRIVYQDLTRINQSIENRSFFENKTLLDLAAKLKKSGKALHLMGLLSDGGVHSHLDHLLALLDFAKQQRLSTVYVHCFMDGRDTPPTAGEKYMRQLEKKLAQVGNATVATVTGRYYAMDRDKRWERTSAAYHALVCGEGEKGTSAAEVIQKAYEKKTGDEFILPTVIEKGNKPIGLIQDGDGICFFNFRADRARQLTQALNEKYFSFFERKRVPSLGGYITMTQYEKQFPYPTLFPPQNLENVFGAVIAKEKLRQFRIAETEKYAHVTYFFNGGREVEFEGEDRFLIPSPRSVATYDLKPEMSAREVTDKILACLDSKKYDVGIINFANPDMVGHSGRLEPTIKAVETVDTCLGTILKKLEAVGGSAIVTSDHGNAEMLADQEGKPHTAHTLNKVPLVLVDPTQKNKKLREGKLCDITPTMLQLLGIPQPKEMTGQSLLN